MSLSELPRMERRDPDEVYALGTALMLAHLIEYAERHYEEEIPELARDMAGKVLAHLGLLGWSLTRSEPPA